MSDFTTRGLVLRRTNYGEADRILSIITTGGKLSAIAKSVRKEKSKLAGSVELFTLTEFTFHQGKSDLLTITGAKMLEHYGKILAHYSSLELAGKILKAINRDADGVDNPEFFHIAKQSLAALNRSVDPSIVEAWAFLNLKKARGEEINLYRDTTGAKLDPSTRYVFEPYEQALRPSPSGDFDADAIKLFRLILTSPLALIAKVQLQPPLRDNLLPLARTLL